jgi:hypothetical protein
MTFLRQGLLILVAAYLANVTPAPAQFVEGAGASRIQFEAKDFGYFFEGLQWPKESGGEAIIFVCWERPVLATYPRETQWVRSAVTDSWQKYSRIEFRGWGECVDGSTGIRITVLTTGPRVQQFGINLDRLKGGMDSTSRSTAGANPASKRRALASNAFDRLACMNSAMRSGLPTSRIVLTLQGNAPRKRELGRLAQTSSH